MAKSGKRLVVLAVLLATAVCASLFLGSVPIWKTDASLSVTILSVLRLPRTIACLLAGSALAVSGYVLQAVLANPLASPSITGIQSGAGLANLIVCALFPMSFGLSMPAAFVGAILSSSLILGLASHFRSSRSTIVLAGLAMGQIFGAGMDLVLTLVPDAAAGYADFRVGGFAGITSSELVLPGIAIITAIILIMSCTRQLEVLMTGEAATTLGLDTKKWTLILMGLASLLGACVVSFAGLIGFAGLIVPHIIRRQVDGSTLAQLAGCVLGGGAFMIVCDVIARVIAAPFELPAGILLSLAGGPYFLWLLFHGKGHG